MDGLIDDGTDGLTARIIGAAIQVHRHFGPGLLENAYERCLLSEFRYLGIRARRQVPVPLCYREVQMDCGYRMDLLVEEQVIVELKVVRTLAPVHTAQVLTYLGLADLHVGLLINFNVEVLASGGVKRILRKRGDR